MVNSTSATAAVDINEEECKQVGLSPTAGSVASEGGGIFRHDGDVNSNKAVNSMAAAMELWGVVEGRILTWW